MIRARATALPFISDAVENTWHRSAQDRTAFLPLPGREGRGERWCHRLSSPICAHGAVSRVLRLAGFLSAVAFAWLSAGPPGLAQQEEQQGHKNEGIIPGLHHDGSPGPGLSARLAHVTNSRFC